MNDYVQMNDISTVKRLYQRRKYFTNRALSIAVENNYIDIVKFIVENNSDSFSFPYNHNIMTYLTRHNILPLHKKEWLNILKHLIIPELSELIVLYLL